MGFNAWRNLSVLLLAGVVLAGCNNNAQKDKNVVAGPKATDPLAKGQPTTPGPAFPNSSTPFPTQAPANVNNPPKNPFTTTSGNTNNPATPNPAFPTSVAPSNFPPPSNQNSFTPSSGPNFPTPGGPNIPTPGGPSLINPANSSTIVPPPAPGQSNFGTTSIYNTNPPSGAGNGPINVPVPPSFPNR
jgi:hypothetical protein